MLCWLLTLAFGPLIQAGAPAPEWLIWLDRAETLRLANRAKDAVSAYEQALTLARRTEPDDVATALVQHNTAFFHHQAGRLAEAEPLYQRSYRWFDSHRPDYLPSAMRAVVNLAVVYVETGRWRQAETLLAPWLEVVGGREGDLTRLRGVYASALARQGKFAHAEPLLQSVKAAIEQEAPSVWREESLALTISNLAAIYESTGRHAEALESYAQALRMLFASPNLQPVALVRTLHEAAGVQDDRTALTYYRQALELADQQLGPEHPVLATVLPGYVNLLRKLHRGGEARKLEKRAHVLQERYIKDNLLGHTVDVKSFSQ